MATKRGILKKLVGKATDYGAKVNPASWVPNQKLGYAKEGLRAIKTLREYRDIEHTGPKGLVAGLQKIGMISPDDFDASEARKKLKSSARALKIKANIKASLEGRSDQPRFE